MTPDHFEATFRIRLRPDEAWSRLTGRAGAAGEGWLPGFDSLVEVVDADPPGRLHATKAQEPCAGTDIVVTLEDDASGTVVRVIQSGFGAWLSERYEPMVVGWRFIVADLQTFLATGVHARRHLRPWGDLGADATALDGGVLVRRPRPGGLADRLGMADGDLLVSLAGAPLASLDDLITALRVIDGRETLVAAEWIRAGALVSSPAR